MGRRGRRFQSGCFHVILAANYQTILFDDDYERVKFLEIMHFHLKKRNGVIRGFALMHTHIHLQVVTDELSPLMRCILHDYSMWYNKKRKQRGNIFKRPFSSHIKIGFDSQLRNLMYILQNPYVDGLCSHPRYHAWSSYNAYFAPHCYVANYIDIDVSFIRSAFNSAGELYRYVSVISAEKLLNITERMKYPRVLDDVVLEYVKNELNGKAVLEMSSGEVRDMILKLRKETLASYRQISSVLHISLCRVRRTIGVLR